MYKLFSILLTFLFLSTVPLISFCQEQNNGSVAKKYQRAKFYYNQLETNQKIGSSRDNWLKGVRNFRKIYLTSPKSDIAPSCLFMLGRMYYRMFERFNKLIDLNEALSYYRDNAALFSDNKLADDSLFAIGTILLTNTKNIKGASQAFNKIVSEYPNGDMHPQAATQLKALSRDHDIPLPKVMVGTSNPNNLTTVLPVKYWSSDNYTRVVIKASGPVTYKEQLLEPSGNHPRRLYIDFQKSYIEPRFRQPVPIEDGLLKRIRTGQFSSDTVRVVLDIESIHSYKVFSLPDPFRVVIDIRGKQGINAPATRPQVAQKPPGKTQSPPIAILKGGKKYRVGKSRPKTGISTPTPTRQPTYTLAQQLGLGVRKIVLDPGHGGKDPGAMAFGLKEKDIVLLLARRLTPILEKQLGCEVILTRKRDVFIPLEERTAIANTSDADLFISLHINAHPAPKVHGLETYYLNLSTNDEAIRVAARENSTSTHQMSDLQDILSDIMKNSKVEESTRLAGLVHKSIINGLTTSRFKNIKDLGVKQAPFYVLIGAQMPAVLIEVAFISNPQDAKHLTTDAFLNTVTQEISNGIQSYIRGTIASLGQR